MSTVDNELIPVPPVVTHWAREQLELGEGSLPSARVAVLRRLAGEDFLPSPAWDAAYRIADASQRYGYRATAGAVNVATAQLGDIERRLAQGVACFAAGFFEMPVEQRTEHWSKLVKHCEAFPALLARLLHLQIGLNVEFETLASASQATRDLAAHVARLFTLPPRTRAIARHQPAAELQTSMRDWEHAAQTLVTQFRPIAELDTVLVRELIARKKDREPGVRVR